MRVLLQFLHLLVLSLEDFLHGSCKTVSLICCLNSGISRFRFNLSTAIAKVILKPIAFSEYGIVNFFM